jgi:hypothetical protein
MAFARPARAGLSCLALLLGGCATPLVGTQAAAPEVVEQDVAGSGFEQSNRLTNSAPRISALPPHDVQQGKAASVQLPGIPWSPGMQLALVSAGPYLTHQSDLTSPAVAMVMDHQRAFVVTADRHLSIVDFPESEATARILARLSLDGPVRQLAYANNRLLVQLVDGRMQWLDVSHSETPLVLATLPSPGQPRDLQLDDDGFAYLLLTANTGKPLLQRWIFRDGEPFRQDRQWDLPVEAVAIAVRGQHVWTVSPDGIAVLDISGDQALLRDFQSTSGTPSDVQLQNELALVADGRGGLVLFDISKPAHLQWRGSFNKRGAVRGFSIGEAPSVDRASSNVESALLNLQNGTVMRLGLDNPELPSSGATFRADAPVVLSAVQGDVALLATERSLQRVMMVGKGDGAISPEGVNLGGSRRGVISDEGRGDILYVADWFSGLHLYDISNPRQLRHIANYHTPGSSKGVALMGHYALVGDDDQGLQIIDIKDPRHPSWTAELPPEAMARLGLAYTMKRVGKILYLADHRGGFHIIDLSDIRHPRRLGGYPTPGKAWGIDVENGVAFVADDRAGLLMFDVSNPAKPEPFAQFNPGGQAEDVALQDGRAYVAFFDKGLYTLDVSDPRQPKVIAHTPIPGNARGIELGDGLLYVASWEAGLQILDTRLSDDKEAAAPRIIGSFDTDGDAWGVKVKDGYAYVLDWWGGIKVVDVRQPTRPTYVDRYQARGTVQQLRAKGNYLFAASGAGGLQVYDIKNPLNPIWAKGLDINGQSLDLWLEDDRAYVAAGDGGVAIFDTLDPFYTQQVGGIDTPGEATLVRASNEYLYIADSLAGLLVMDVRDPQRPVEVARYDVQVQDMWSDEQTLWLVADAGLSAWAMAGDGHLSQKTTLPGAFTRVRVQADLVVAATRTGIIKLWRRGAQGLNQLAEIPSGDTITGLQLDGDRLYWVGQRNGLQAVDIRQPQSPRWIAAYPVTGHHTHVAIARGAAFLAGGSKPASVTLLPAAAVEPDAEGGVRMRVPADLPLGTYHLLSVAPGGQRRLYPNALNVRFSAPGQRKFSLETFRQILKSPLKPPAEAATEIPAEVEKSQ